MNYKAIVITTGVVLAFCLSTSVVGIIGSTIEDNNRVYSINYVLNGGINSDENPSTHKSGSELTLSDPRYEGHIFTGWYSDSELTQRKDTIEKGTTGTVTVYAGWDISLVGKTLVYDMSGTVSDTSNSGNYPLTGLASFEFLDYDKNRGYHIISNMSMEIIILTSTVRSADADDYWSNENDEETVTKGDTKTISTNYGTKTCTVWIYKSTKNTETQYVGDDGIVYRLELESKNGTQTINMDYDLIGINDPTKTTLTKNYSWNYKGVPYNMTLNIAHSDFVKYRADTITRSQGTNQHDLKFVTYNDKYVKEIADRINVLSAGMSDADKIGMVLAFTQYIQYQYDNDSVGQSEYWKYPVETLIDMEGDCEDTSILFCAIARQMGFDTCMIIYSDHMAAGVNLGGLSGYYYTFDTKHYYYCETTANWNIGHDPNSGYYQVNVNKYIIVT